MLISIRGINTWFHIFERGLLIVLPLCSWTLTEIDGKMLNATEVLLMVLATLNKCVARFGIAEIKAGSASKDGESRPQITCMVAKLIDSNNSNDLHIKTPLTSKSNWNANVGCRLCFLLSVHFSVRLSVCPSISPAKFAVIFSIRYLIDIRCPHSQSHSHPHPSRPFR